MSREKQIEEVCETCLHYGACLLNSEYVPSPCCKYENKENWRKQSEGRWEKRVFIIFDSEKVGFRCSECNTTWDTETHYCPNCGAKMKGGAG